MDAGRVGGGGGQSRRVLDGDLLETLVADLGTDTVRGLIDLFLDDVPGRLAALRAAVDAGDHHLAAKVAHAMKSASSSVGAVAFAARCDRVETLAAAQRLHAVRTELDHLPHDLAMAAGALATTVADGPAAAGGR